MLALRGDHGLRTEKEGIHLTLFGYFSSQRIQLSPGASGSADQVVGGGEQRSGKTRGGFRNSMTVTGFSKAFAAVSSVCRQPAAYEKMALSNPVGTGAAERRSTSHPAVISAASQVDENHQKQAFFLPNGGYHPPGGGAVK